MWSAGQLYAAAISDDDLLQAALVRGTGAANGVLQGCHIQHGASLDLALQDAP